MSIRNIIPEKIHPKIWKNGMGNIDDIIFYALNSYSPMARTEFITDNKIKRMNKNTFHSHARELKKEGFIDSYREGKNSYYIILPSGENELSRRLIDYKLDFETLLAIEEKKGKNLVNQLANFFRENQISNDKIKVQFLKLASIISFDKLKILFKTQDKFNKLLLFLVLNHPKFYPEESISIVDFREKYNDLSNGILTKPEIEIFIQKVIDEREYGINFHKLVLPKRGIELYFTEKSEYGQIFQISVDTALENMMHLKNLGVIELNEKSLKDTYEYILKVLVSDYHLFDPDLTHPLSTLIEDYRKSLKEKIIEQSIIDKRSVSKYFPFASFDTSLNISNVLNELSILGVDDDLFENLLFNPNDLNPDELRKKLKNINKRLKLFPEDDKALIAKSLIFFEIGMNQEAMKILDKVIELNSEWCLCYSIKARFLAKIEQFESALQNINKAIEFHPNYPDHMLFKAVILLNLEKYDDALLIAEKFFEKEEELGYHNFKSNVLLSKGDIDGAIEELEQAIKEDPMDINLLHNKVYLLIRKEKLDEALELIFELRKIYPNDAGLYSFEGEIYTYKNQFKKALKIYDIVIKLDPSDYLSFGAKGAILHNNLNDSEEALINVNKGLDIKPYAKDLLYNKIIILDNLKKFDDAIDVANKALELYASNLEFIDLKANILVELDRIDDSTELVKKLIKIDPYFGDYYNTYGKIFLKTKEYEKAIMKFGKAIELSHDDKILDNVYISLGECYKEVGDYKKAKELLNKGKELAVKMGFTDIKLIEKADKLLLDIDDILSKSEK